MMIKTPVSRHKMFTSSFVDKLGYFLDDAQMNDAQKRINMHDELVDELEQIKIFLDEMHVMPVNWITKEGVYRHAVVCELLERCK